MARTSRSRLPTVRSTRKRVSYKEATDSEEPSEEEYDLPQKSSRKRPAALAVPAPRKVPKANCRRRVLPSPQTKPQTKGRAQIPAEIRQEQSYIVPSDDLIPPWADLPYEILLSVFRYASNPLWDVMWRPSPSIYWLLDTARVCKAFTEPALAALYESPPLLYADTPHRLLDLLKSTQTPSFMNYRAKIKRLELDVKRTLSYTTPGRGLLSISELVASCPQLSNLSIYDVNDNPPYRYIGKATRWSYPDALFESLERGNIRLKTWRWNGDLMGRQTVRIRQIHEIESFKNLRDLSLSHIGIKSSVESTDSPQSKTRTVANTSNAPKALLTNDILLPLVNLRSLSLESCRLYDPEFLLNTSSTLSRLEIVNCVDLHSEQLQQFLTISGSQLEQLCLNHNSALDLSFLCILGDTCPRLRRLEMDMTYYSTLSLTRNFSESYDSLMDEADVPSWPSTLETLEMLHLRKWGLDAAETFFNSLLHNAENLPNLRRLVIKAILNISWRDRAGFRDTWIGRLRRTFLRNPDPPTAHLASTRAYRNWEDSAVTSKDPKELSKSATNGQNEPARRSKRIKTPALTKSAENIENPRQDDLDDRSIGHIQGMCSIVDVSIDNLRPSEMRFNEDDFIDSELSGDEDWTGGDPEPSTEAYVYC